MIARIRHITIDCREPYRLAQFWSAVLGFVDEPENPNAPDDPEALIVDPTGNHPGLLFVPVPEPKTVKNRVHLDLQPDRLRDEAVDEVARLGGSVIADHRKPDGTGWVVMADPEGNEVCIERSPAERDDTPARVDTGQRPMLLGLRTADERTMLTAMLDWYREGVLRKVEGLGQHHAVARPLPSPTSIAGVVKHLALVEDAWFTERLGGQPPAAPWADIDWDADRDWEFNSARDEPLEHAVALYRAACERSRAIVAARDLDAEGIDGRGHPFSMRFALVHMIEETARHLGHLDVLREHLDGTTGE